MRAGLLLLLASRSGATTWCAGDGPHADPALRERADALGAAGPNRASISRAAEQARCPPSAPGGAQAPVGPPQRRPAASGRTGSSACGSIGNERAGVCTNQPRATRRSSAANAARRSGATCSITLERVGEVERAVGEGQALGGVGLHERPGIVRARGEVDARDVEVGLEAAQAERAAADVDDAHAGLDAGHARRSARGAVRRAFAASGPSDARAQAPAGGRVDVL